MGDNPEKKKPNKKNKYKDKVGQSKGEKDGESSTSQQKPQGQRSDSTAGIQQQVAEMQLDTRPDQKGGKKGPKQFEGGDRKEKGQAYDQKQAGDARQGQQGPRQEGEQKQSRQGQQQQPRQGQQGQAYDQRQAGDARPEQQGPRQDGGQQQSRQGQQGPRQDGGQQQSRQQGQGYDQKQAGDARPGQQGPRQDGGQQQPRQQGQGYDQRQAGDARPGQQGPRQDGGQQQSRQGQQQQPRQQGQGYDQKQAGDSRPGQQELKQDGGQQQPRQGPGGQQQRGNERKPYSPQESQRASPATDEQRRAASSDPFNEGKMKIDKEKIHKSQLMPIHQRANAFGTKGQSIPLEVNYLEIQVAKMIDKAYHYDVAIEPELPKRLLRDAVAEFNKQHFPSIAFAYDGSKSVYTGRPLQKDFTAEVTVFDVDWKREKKFKITIKFAAEVDLNSLKTFSGNSTNTEKPSTAIQCLDVVLRTAIQNNPRFVRHKRTLYHKPEKPIDLGESHELWLGLFQSCILGAKPYLNVDVSHKAFPTAKPLLNVIRDMGRGGNDLSRQLSTWMTNDLENFLKGMNVSYHPPNQDSKLFKFNALREPASSLRFRDENQREMTIQQYFLNKNIILKYPHLPTVHIGSLVRTVYVPLEFCSLPPGMALNKRHPDSCTQVIIRQAATSTDDRKRKIMDLLKNIPFSNSEAVRQFQISVAEKFAQIVARIIPAPKLMYKGGSDVIPARGVWNGRLFLETPANKIKWAIMNLEPRCRDGEIKEFANKLIDQGGKQGIMFEAFRYGDGQCYAEPRVDRGRFQDKDVLNIMTGFKQSGVKLLVCIIPQSEETYAKVKQLAELRCGILTQCLKANTVQRKMDLSTVGNILLKLNAKLNGVNHNIFPNSKPPILRQRVMAIGADVTHPAPDQMFIPSVVGVAASTDQELCRYTFAYRLQNPKDEMIRDLENIVLKQFKDYWFKNNKLLPEHIFYYRDGVSEGQFQEILTIELKAIQSAIINMGRTNQVEWKPKLTFVCVQKRHHTRFFPDPGFKFTEGRHRNLPPGTVVDKQITKPMEYQFFLISHASVQGVAKPAKYCILYDNAACDPDQLQAMTYYLCHLFTRCNRSVSYPAPTYYAHLAAFRGRMYIKNDRIDLNNLQRAYTDRTLKDDVILGHPMFFV